MWKSLVVALVFGIGPVRAALVDDAGFGTAGAVDIELGLSEAPAPPALIALPDRRIVAASIPGSADTQPAAVRVVRLLPDGRRDLSFGVGGVTTVALATPASAGGVTKIVPLANGGMLVLGATVYVEDTPGGSIFHYRTHLLRLLDDGSADPLFNGGRAWTEDGNVLARGDVFVQGATILLVAGSDRLEARRLRSDGTPDPMFGTGGSVSQMRGGSYGVAALSLPNGGFQVLSRVFYAHGQPARNFWERFRADGSVDVSFGSGGRLNLPQADFFRAVDQLLPLGDGTLLGSIGACPRLQFDDEGRVLAELPACAESWMTSLVNVRAQRFGSQWLFSGDEPSGLEPRPTAGTWLFATDLAGLIDAAFAAPQGLRWRPPDLPVSLGSVAVDGDGRVLVARGADTGLRIRRYRNLLGGDPVAEPVPALVPAGMVLLGLGLLLLARRRLRTPRSSLL